jgi:hypothetical protein
MSTPGVISGGVARVGGAAGTGALSMGEGRGQMSGQVDLFQDVSGSRILSVRPVARVRAGGAVRGGDFGSEDMATPR